MKNCYLVGLIYVAASTLSAFAGTDAKDMKEIAAVPAPITSDAGFYLALEGGANFSQSHDRKQIETGNGPGSLTGTATNYGSGDDGIGAVGGVKFGYNFESYDIGDGFGLQPAVEEEVMYVGSYDKNKYTIASANGGFGPFTGFPYSTRDTFNNVAFLTNGIVRFKTGTLFTPYLGLGVGGEYVTNDHVKLKNIGNAQAGNMSDGNSLNVAANALIGFDIEVAKGWDLFTEYKYLVAFDPVLSNTITTSPGTTFTYASKLGWYSQNLVTAGIKYNF